MGKTGFAYTGYKRKAGKKKAEKDPVPSLPSVINHAACWTAYRLEEGKCELHSPPNPKVKNCKHNPYCIHRLGNERWEKLVREQIENPTTNLKRRDIERQPCGLENFGNFCYVNSFLQIWYNDLVFRQCIYDWRGIKNYEKPESMKMDIQAVMNCLQELFVTMQLTPFEHTDAQKLIALLKLDNEQHDVQEFSILFFDALDRNLAFHPNGELSRQAFRSRFEGQMRQVLKCNCGYRSVSETVLRSLQLHINGCNSLTKALENYFQPENVADFRCSSCAKCGNVSTMSECAVLPPVLMITLNRYLFDQNGRKKKITTALQYPRLLAEKTLRPDADPDSYYELSAVMIHEGQSAHCGHYYDLIKDPRNGQWFSYNDKAVTECRTPGVLTEKQVVSRATPDMKGCYALIYRKTDTHHLMRTRRGRRHVNSLADSEGDEEDEEIIISGTTPTTERPETPKELTELRMPPPEIVADIEKRLNDAFQRESRDGSCSFEVWRSCIEERRLFLEETWERLEVNPKHANRKTLQIQCTEGRRLLKTPNTVAFLPTAFLSEIQHKEYNAVKRMKDLDEALNGQFTVNGTANGASTPLDSNVEFEEARELIGSSLPDESFEDYIERVNEKVDELREEREMAAAHRRAAMADRVGNSSTSDPETLKLLYLVDSLSDVQMPLCAHDKVSLDAVLKGEVKAVMRTAAERLLKDYLVGVRRVNNAGISSGSSSNEGSPQTASLKTGFVFTHQNLDIDFRMDLCCDCVQLKKKEVDFKQQLEERSNLAAAIIKRATAKNTNNDTMYLYPPNGTMWISRKALISYKKLATQEMDYQKSLVGNNQTCLLFSSRYNGFIESVRHSTRHENGNGSPAAPIGRSLSMCQPSPVSSRRRQRTASTQFSSYSPEPRDHILNGHPRSALSSPVKGSHELKIKFKKTRKDGAEKVFIVNKQPASEEEPISPPPSPMSGVEESNEDQAEEKPEKNGENGIKPEIATESTSLGNHVAKLKNNNELKEMEYVKSEGCSAELDNPLPTSSVEYNGIANKESKPGAINTDVPNDVLHEGITEMNLAEGAEQNANAANTATEDEDRNSVASTKKESENADSDVEIVGEVLRKVNQVHFNGDLICQHGGLDCKAKKVWVTEGEWNTLVEGSFLLAEKIPVSRPTCAECSEQFDIGESMKNDCQSKLAEIQQNVGKMLRAVEKRRWITSDLGEKYTRLLCPKFLYRYRHAIKSKATIIPPICQECIRCSEHSRRFLVLHPPPAIPQINASLSVAMDNASAAISNTVPLNAETVPITVPSYDGFTVDPIPLTGDEWTRLIDEYRRAQGDEFIEPIEIPVATAEDANEFCEECWDKYKADVEHSRCVYPQGADIYVKLKDDTADEAPKPSTSRAAVPTTRRVSQKNIIKVRMFSTDKVFDLKTELYNKTHQSPVDQLIYRGETLLTDNQTLEEARVAGNNSESPLILITQQQTEFGETPRQLERGFRDTALSSY